MRPEPDEILFGVLQRISSAQDRELTIRIWANTEKALNWIDHYGDRNGDGFYRIWPTNSA